MFVITRKSQKLKERIEITLAKKNGVETTTLWRLKFYIEKLIQFLKKIQKNSVKGENLNCNTLGR